MIDLSAERLRQLDDQFGNQIKTLMSNPVNIADAVAEADLLICAVLIPGAKRRLGDGRDGQTDETGLGDR